MKPSELSLHDNDRQLFTVLLKMIEDRHIDKANGLCNIIGNTNVDMIKVDMLKI